MKTCLKCGFGKDLSEFGTNRRRPDGHQSRCKDCINTPLFKKKAREKSARWREDNPGRYKIWQQSHRELRMVDRARSRAKRDGIAFDITVEDISIPEFCPILGLRLGFNDDRQQENSPSLDRILPELGYVRGNIWVISHRANRIKNDATLAELEMLVAALKGK